MSNIIWPHHSREEMEALAKAWHQPDGVVIVKDYEKAERDAFWRGAFRGALFTAFALLFVISFWGNHWPL